MFDEEYEETREEAQERCNIIADDPLSLMDELDEYCYYKHDKARFSRFDYHDEVEQELAWQQEPDVDKAYNAVDNMVVEMWLDGNNFPDMMPDEVIDFFKYSDKSIIMKPADYEVWKGLPSEVTLYRGSTTGDEFGRVKLSWTLNPKKAWFFAEENAMRKGGFPVVYEIHIPNYMCLAYFSELKEDEIIVDVFELAKQRIRIHPCVGYRKHIREHTERKTEE